MTVSLSFILFVVTAVWTQSVSSHGPRFEPWPRCLVCTSRRSILAPGFGIELTESYGTAAVRYHNGSSAPLVKVEASVRYKSLMRRLDNVSQTISTSKVGEQSMISSQIPSFDQDQEALIIGELLTSLKVAIKAKQNIDIDKAVIVFPQLAGLDQYLSYPLLHNAAAQAQIHLLLDEPNSIRPDIVGAAAAGNGMGLCRSYTEPDVCEVEEEQMPLRLIYGLHYTNSSLTVALTPLRQSRYSTDWIHSRSWDLGWNDRGSPSYDSRLKDKLRDLPLHLDTREITDLVLMGESVLGGQFLNQVKDALWDLFQKQSVSVVDSIGAEIEDPSFVAARGAAEFAKRAMEAPDGCVEGWVCKKWRKLVNGK